MSAMFTRTIHEIKATVLVANAKAMSFENVEVSVDDGGINWKGYTEKRISDDDVMYYILRTLTKSNDDTFTADRMPVKVLNWERIAGKYECTLEDFLKIAKKVD